MTLKEKSAQITAVWTEKVRIFDDSFQLDPSKLAQRFPHGMGQFPRPSDAKGAFSPREIPGRNPRQTGALANPQQRWATTHTRLGIPLLFHGEGLHEQTEVDRKSKRQNTH